MKQIILSLAVAVMATMAVNAQQAESPMQQKHFRHHQHGKDDFAGKLHLTDQQKQQTKSINSDFHTKLADLKKQEDITVREYKSRMAGLQKERRSQIEALFTPEQKDQLAKMKQERMKLAKVNATARAERMKVKLNLTDAQAGQLKTLRSDMMTKMKSIHADSSLSREQKHEQVKSLVMQQKEQMKTILSAEQLQQLEQMKAEHHRHNFSK